MKIYLSYLKSKKIDIKGTPIYIAPTVSFDGKDYSKIHIGDKTVISTDVMILTHDYSISRAIESTGVNLKREVYFLRDVHVGNNCFIGAKSLLMPGCNIGNNVIVGAGSIVRGNIPDNSIVIGNPATVIGNVIDWGNKKIKENSYHSND